MQQPHQPDDTAATGYETIEFFDSIEDDKTVQVPSIPDRSEEPLPRYRRRTTNEQTKGQRREQPMNGHPTRHQPGRPRRTPTTEEVPAHFVTQLFARRYQRRNVAIGLLSFVGGWVGLNWIQQEYQELYDHYHYGDALLSEADIPVGHGAISHFLAFYRSGTVYVLEFPNDGAGQAREYFLSVADKQDQTRRVVTLVLDTRNANKNLRVHIEGFQVEYPLYNTGDRFDFNQERR